MYNTKKIMLNLPINIYFMRKKHKMTAKELGKRLNKAESTITAWERAEKTPSFESIIKICNIFDCSLNMLLEENVN